jgi:flagellar export protein FliJ
MKRFQFRLQSVLEHRERKENIAQMNFGEAQTQLNRALIMLQELEEVRDAIIGELSERRLSSSFDPVESKLYHDYLKTIKQCIIDQNAYVADLTSGASGAR